MDSGAAVSLIHLQAYKLMPDTLKTAITLPGELETLTTADGSPMHIIGHATITLHLKNLRVTHHFIVVESLMTDVILGIDFQRECRISYDWDEEKWCYIRHKGQFLCYTEDMESEINRVSIAKTIHIPPKHNEAISVSIKGHDIKTPTACFIGSQYTDPEAKLIGHATITLHLKNLRVTHHFIVVESLMTDVILGIDFQRECRISYDWDEEKWCYIRHKGQFLCYTEDTESGINRVSVAKTIHIPPKHNGAISDIKTPTACFIGSQYMDPEDKLIDGVHDISCNVTLQVLVINNSNQHVNFPKGMKIGHLEPPIDDLTQIPINSATTQ